MNVLGPIHIALDGQATVSETTMRDAGPHVLTLTTALPDVPMTIVSTYIGADDVDTTVVLLVLTDRPNARRRTRSLSRGAMPVTYARDHCVMDHLAYVRATLDVAVAAHVTIDVSDAALAAVAG